MEDTVFLSALHDYEEISHSFIPSYLCKIFLGEQYHIFPFAWCLQLQANAIVNIITLYVTACLKS